MNRATFTTLTGAIAGMLATKSFAADSAGSMLYFVYDFEASRFTRKAPPP